jgi:hypothetical protein
MLRRVGLLSAFGRAAIPVGLVLALALALVLALAACSKMSVTLDEPKPVPFEVQINVVSDPGVPLGDAQILHGTKLVGTTTPAGAATVRFGGAEGDQVDLVVKCPADYESPAKPLTVSLRRFAPGSLPPKFETRCPPALRSLVVGLRADNGPNLPVTYLGRTVARTDASGAALFVLRVKPADPIQITINTSEPGAEMLRPQNPNLTLVGGEKDDYIVLDQTFTVLHKVVPRVVHQTPIPL